MSRAISGRSSHDEREVTEDLGTRLAEIKGAKLVKSFCYTCPWQCPTEVTGSRRQGRLPQGQSRIAQQHRLALRQGHGERPTSRATPTASSTRCCAPIPRAQPGQFKRISWDEAFTFIADKLAAIRDKWGPEAVAYTCHHDPNTIFFRHLLGDLYGSPNNYTHTSGCEQDRRAACLTHLRARVPDARLRATRAT